MNPPSGSSQARGDSPPRPNSRPPAPRTAREMLDLARQFLERKGLGAADSGSNPRREAELLVAHALELDRLKLYLRLDQPLTGAEVDRARDLLVRRGRREPTAYIVGSREFFGREMLVGEGALVPRPETEGIVDRAREIARERGGAPLRVLDVGTGSGCLAVTLALELDGAHVDAIDVSEAALQWAKRNVDAHEANVTLHLGEGLEVGDRLVAADGPYDLVVSNPPYVEPSERDDLSPEVREHEPPLALYSPPNDADHWVRAIAERAHRWLTEPGAALVELGHLQGPRIGAIAGAAGVWSQVHDDLAGIARVAEFRRSRPEPVQPTPAARDDRSRSE